MNAAFSLDLDLTTRPVDNLSHPAKIYYMYVGEIGTIKGAVLAFMKMDEIIFLFFSIDFVADETKTRSEFFFFSRSFKAGSPGRASGLMLFSTLLAPKPGKKALGMRLVLSAFLNANISTEYPTVLAFAVCC